MTLGYEVSNHMISGQIAQTFILVDTADGATSWRPNGKYTYGKSNYDVSYCCDVKTDLESTTQCKRINLEDSNYYGAVASQHIRAILQNAYPFVTIDEMKASLKAGGLSADFVDELTCAELIPGVGESLSEVPTAVETINIVSVYPKNETVPPPEEDAETETIVCNGVQYAVVPVVVDGSQLILTTDENGWTISPDLSCGLYYLVETKTPAGYNMLEEAVSVSVTSSVMTEITTIRIANQRGHLLPETGGEGREAPGFILVLRHTQQAGASFCRKSTRLGFLRDECGQKGNIGRQTQKNYQKTAKILTLPKQRGII